VQVAALVQSERGFGYSLLLNSCIAYLVNLLNFLVTKYTSALTLQARVLRIMCVACCPPSSRLLHNTHQLKVPCCIVIM
jgi:hypothetical protein